MYVILKLFCFIRLLLDIWTFTLSERPERRLWAGRNWGYHALPGSKTWSGRNRWRWKSADRHGFLCGVWHARKTGGHCLCWHHVSRQSKPWLRKCKMFWSNPNHIYINIQCIEGIRSSEAWLRQFVYTATRKYMCMHARVQITVRTVFIVHILNSIFAVSGKREICRQSTATFTAVFRGMHIKNFKVRISQKHRITLYTRSSSELHVFCERCHLRCTRSEFKTCFYVRYNLVLFLRFEHVMGLSINYGFQKRLKHNNDGKDYMVGTKVSFRSFHISHVTFSAIQLCILTCHFCHLQVTYCDYFMLDLLINLNDFAPDCLASYPLLTAYMERMMSRDKIKKLRESDEMKSMPVTFSGRLWLDERHADFYQRKTCWISLSVLIRQTGADYFSSRIQSEERVQL